MNQNHKQIAKEIATNLTHEDEPATLDELEKSFFMHEDLLNYIYAETDDYVSNEKKNEIINHAFKLARKSQN